ncbi:MAG: YraN family protein [Pseudomonadaceae bacterium]|nr:YraN family protein [Pseudomonadaceae bacterium]
MLRKDKGSRGEQTALEYLLENQLTLVERNYSCRSGEIDLIMIDRSTAAESLVFLEVRYRSTQQFGGAAASVDPAKQKKLILTARHFLKTHRQFTSRPARFDVVALSGNPEQPDLCWIRQAFQA